MRILLLSDRIPPESQGGAEAVVWRLARGLAAAGHDTHIIATTAGPGFDDRQAGVQRYHIQAGYPERFRAWLSLYNPQTVGAFSRLLSRIQPDIVNAHNVHHYLSWHTLKLAHEAGCGVVFSAHDAMAFAYGKLPMACAAARPATHRLPRGFNLRQNRLRYNPARDWIIRRHLQRHAHIRSVPSQALAAAFADNDMPPVEVAHNGIDLEAWARADESCVEALRQKLNLAGKRVILIAGRLTREKGLRQMLLALDVLRRRLPDVRLLVLTARDIDAQLQAEFAHLRPLIRGAGWLAGEELRAAYQLAHVVAVPSIYLDPFPTVNLEAMALGKPVVASCFGGASEVVSDGQTGYIVNPLDTAAFAARLEALLSDDSLRRTMGQRGRQRIEAHFSLAHQVGRMLELYESALRLR